VHAGSHGLRVTPKASLSVQGQIVSSGTWVLPITIAPASRSRRTISLSAAAGCLITAVPKHVGSPATSWSSLIATGTPYSGRPSRSPSASARARGRAARLEPHWVRPQWPAAWAAHAAVGVVGSLLSVSLPAVGLAVLAVTLVSYALDLTGRAHLLRALFPRRATQVVVSEPA